MKNKIVLFQKPSLSYVLNDGFNVDSATLISPRQALPGPGQLTIADTNGRMSISNGQLQWSGLVTVNDRIVSSSVFTRKGGRTLFLTIPTRTAIAGNGAVNYGWAPIANSGVMDFGFDVSTTLTATRIRSAGGGLVDTIDLGSYHAIALMMRPTGGLIFARSTNSGPYTLYWVQSVNSTNLYARIMGVTASSNTLSFDDLKVLDFPTYTQQYSLATDTKLGTLANGVTFNHTADFVLEYTMVYTGSDVSVQVRRSDAANSFELWAQSNGAFTLYRNKTGNNASVASSAGAFTNGNTYTIVVTVEQNVYKLYVNGALRVTYTDSLNHNIDQTSGIIVSNGTNVSDISTWPRKVQLPN